MPTALTRSGSGVINMETNWPKVRSQIYAGATLWSTRQLVVKYDCLTPDWVTTNGWLSLSTGDCQLNAGWELEHIRAEAGLRRQRHGTHRHCVTNHCTSRTFSLNVTVTRTARSCNRWPQQSTSLANCSSFLTTLPSTRPTNANTHLASTDQEIVHHG